MRFFMPQAQIITQCTFCRRRLGKTRDSRCGVFSTYTPVGLLPGFRVVGLLWDSFTPLYQKTVGPALQICSRDSERISLLTNDSNLSEMLCKGSFSVMLLRSPRHSRFAIWRFDFRFRPQLPHGAIDDSIRMLITINATIQTNRMSSL